MLVPDAVVRRRMLDVRSCGAPLHHNPVVGAKEDPDDQHGAEEEAEESNEESRVDGERAADATSPARGESWVDTEPPASKEQNTHVFCTHRETKVG